MEITKKGITEKVDFLLTIAKKGQCSNEEFADILKLLVEHSDKERLGKVFGYSVSDYAIATLAWIGDDKSYAEYNKIYTTLDEKRKLDITQLVKEKRYLQY